VRFRETCLAVIVDVARVRDEVLYTFFTAPSTPLLSCQTLVLANVRQAPHPLHCPLAGTLLLFFENSCGAKPPSNIIY
jgi:hypothetical protein